MFDGMPRLDQPVAQPGQHGAHGRIWFRGIATLSDATVRINLTATDPHGESVTGHIIFNGARIANNSTPSFTETASARSFPRYQEIAPFVLPAATGGDVATALGTAIPNPTPTR